MDTAVVFAVISLRFQAERAKFSDISNGNALNTFRKLFSTSPYRSGLLLLALIAEWILGRSALPEPPRIVLWAWERPEDLRFLLGETRAEVAAVTRTVRIEGANAYTYQRIQPLNIPPGVKWTPVVHVDVFQRTKPALNEEQRITIVEAVLASSKENGGNVQLDFEVLRSQRDFYKQVLSDIREQAPKIKLSVTALASWCAGDRWIGSLPADEIVAMAFRMGRDAPKIRDSMAASGRLPDKRCTGLGLSLDEPWATSLQYPRIHVFNPRSWTEQDYVAIKKKLAS